MSLKLPADLAEFVQQEIASGRFATQDDVVLAGLQLLKNDRDEAIAGIRQGLDEWRRGEGSPLEEVAARLRSKHGLTDRE